MKKITDPLYKDEVPTGEYSVAELFRYEDKMLRRKGPVVWGIFIASVFISIPISAANLALGAAGLTLWMKESQQMTLLGLGISLVLVIMSLLSFTGTIAGFKTRDIELQGLGIIAGAALLPMGIIALVLLNSFATSA